MNGYAYKSNYARSATNVMLDIPILAEVSFIANAILDKGSLPLPN